MSDRSNLTKARLLGGMTVCRCTHSSLASSRDTPSEGRARTSCNRCKTVGSPVGFEEGAGVVVVVNEDNEEEEEEEEL